MDTRRLETASRPESGEVTDRDEIAWVVPEGTRIETLGGWS